jgi:Domain of unknown function (DUF4430)
MTRLRGMAVATALLGAALAAAGCGLGPGADVGSVELTVTREYGVVPVLQRSLEAKESDTVMRLLERNADIQTRYGGGFVQSIDGVEEAERGGDPYDWFFYVDGTESPVGAADVNAQGGERIWWDYRNWAATNHVPAVVGSWPAPFVDGVAGKRYPVVVECFGGGASCHTVASALEGAGAEVRLVAVSPLRQGEGRSVATKGPVIHVLVGPWSRLRRESTAHLIEEGPAESGVYADFAGNELVALDEGGAEARHLGPGTGLVAATSRYGGPPIWVVTGGTAAAVREAAAALDTAHLRDHYAVAIEDGKTTPLPVEGR